MCSAYHGSIRIRVGKQLKILITTDWYKPVINGVVTSVLNLASGLRDMGHEVRILTLSDTYHAKTQKGEYFVGSVSIAKIYPEARYMIPVRANFIKEIIDWRPDVIHSQCEFSSFKLARKISKATGAPIVHTYHTVYEDYTHYFSPSKWAGKKAVKTFTRSISKKTDAFIAPSNKTMRLLDKYEIAVPCYMIPSGIDLERFFRERPEKRKAIREKYGIGEDECIMIYIGRLAKEKNVEEILEYLKDERTEGIRLLIVGGGPYKDVLEEEVADRGLNDRVIFTGMVKNKEIADYYRSGDIFVSASNSETQGLTYMEAMASGLPLLCKKDECLDDVVEYGINGYTFSDKEEFMTILSRLVNDPEERKNLGAEARKTMEKSFSVRAFAENCMNVYEEVLHEKMVKLEEKNK